MHSLSVFIKFPEVNTKNDPNLYLNYSKEIENAKPHDCVPVDSNFPLYMLYTSGIFFVIENELFEKNF